MKIQSTSRILNISIRKNLLPAQIRGFAAPKVSKNAILELTEDCPYEYKNVSLKQYHHAIMHPIQQESIKDLFRSAYEHLLQYMCERNYESLQQMLEPKLYQDMSEYLKENIELNEAVMQVENKDTTNFQILVAKHYFTAGFHIDRSKNEKECVVPYKTNFEYKGDLEVFTSKLPMKFTSMPLNIVYELVYKTNLKLNVSRKQAAAQQNKKGLILIEQDEILKPEVHIIRYEGKIADYGNSVGGIVKMKKKYLKVKEQLKNGQLDDVQEWTITNLDNCMMTFKKA